MDHPGSACHQCTILHIDCTYQKKIATQYKHIVHLDRSACQRCTFVHIACHNWSVTAKYCQVVRSAPQQSLSIQSLSILQQQNTRKYTSMDHVVIAAHCKLYSCRRKLCYKAKMLYLLLSQCKLHWVALHRISEQCLETAIVENRKQLLAVVQ